MKPRTSACSNRYIGPVAGLCAAVALLQITGASAQSGAVSEAGVVPQAVPAVQVQAQWQPHELNFHYFGLTTFYSCTGLEERLEQILRQLGAHPDVRVSATGCLGPSDISRSQIARIRVRMPAAPAGGTADAFSATRKVVSLKTHDIGNNGAGACELLEQVRDQLLPKLNIQLVKDDLQCIPGQPSHIGRSLQVQTLVATDSKG